MLKENFFLEGCDYITVAGLTAQQSNNLLPNKLLSNKLNFIYIEARKCVKQSEQNPSRLAQWMTYLRSTSDDVIENLADSPCGVSTLNAMPITASILPNF